MLLEIGGRILYVGVGGNGRFDRHAAWRYGSFGLVEDV